MKARLFIDFWNFQIGWNEVSGGDSCDWTAVPRIFVQQADLVVNTIGPQAPLQLEETIVHASVNPLTEVPLKKWLTHWLDRQPSFDVKIRDRKQRQRSVHCRSCKQSISNCPSCQAALVSNAEKGVDTALVTDLLSLAWQQAYDVAILVTSDADFIPAVEHVQARGLKVVNAAWHGRGHDLRAACWGNFDIDKIVPQLKRT